MIKRILTAIAASVAVAAPVLATPSRGTVPDSDFTSYNLLQVMQANGVMVTINENCKPNVLGAYMWTGMKRTMVLCPGDTVDPIDHATVRHEAWHAIQHCVNVARGTHKDTPVESTDKLVSYVNRFLTEETVNSIKASYPKSQWPTELEANVAEVLFSPEELSKLFLKACTDR